MDARARSGGSRASGFTVVEVTIMSTILVVGVLGMIAAVIAGMRLAAVNRETSAAHEAARAVIERMQSTAFSQIFATYDSDPANDPGGAGTAPGAKFAVAGLVAQKNDLDGLAGDVLFPTIQVGGVDRLSESVTDARWRMPADLNADGIVSAGAMPGTYMILPVRVHVQWRGAGGNRHLDLDHVFVDH